MIPKWLVRLVEQHGPRVLTRLGRSTSRWISRHRLARRVAPLARSHRTRNAGLPADQLRLRNGAIVRVTPDARETYEYFCFRDPDVVAEFDAFDHLTRRSSRLLDIGAEHGFFSIAFTSGRDRARRAIAIEPSRRSHAILVDQIGRNNALVTPLEVAAGDTPGTIDVATHGAHHVTAFSAYDDLGRDRVRIAVRTVDDICREHAFDPDVMKVDVEGYETHVLKGARETLSRCRPLILLEIHPELIRALGHSVVDILSMLADHGYTSVRPRCRLEALSRYLAPGGSTRVALRHRSNAASSDRLSSR